MKLISDLNVTEPISAEWLSRALARVHMLDSLDAHGWRACMANCSAMRRLMSKGTDSDSTIQKRSVSRRALWLRRVGRRAHEWSSDTDGRASSPKKNTMHQVTESASFVPDGMILAKACSSAPCGMSSLSFFLLKGLGSFKNGFFLKKSAALEVPTGSELGGVTSRWTPNATMAHASARSSQVLAGREVFFFLTAPLAAPAAGDALGVAPPFGVFGDASRALRARADGDAARRGEAALRLEGDLVGEASLDEDGRASEPPRRGERFGLSTMRERAASQSSSTFCGDRLKRPF